MLRDYLINVLFCDFEFVLANSFSLPHIHFLISLNLCGYPLGMNSSAVPCPLGLANPGMLESGLSVAFIIDNGSHTGLFNSAVQWGAGTLEKCLRLQFMYLKKKEA